MGFARPVDKPLVHIAEAIMVILFASWDRQTFNSLRPANLPSSLCWGLYNANPLDYWGSSYVCSKASQVRKDKRRIMAQKQRETSVEKRGRPFSYHSTSDEAFVLGFQILSLR